MDCIKIKKGNNIPVFGWYSVETGKVYRTKSGRETAERTIAKNKAKKLAEKFA